MGRIFSFLVLSLVLSVLSTAASAQASSQCCEGLADPSPGAVQIGPFSKFPLEASAQCPEGTGVRAISFSHNRDENLTYQESFYLQCGASDSVVSTQCSWSSWTETFDLSTSIPTPTGSVITGVAFRHDRDQNLTYQQSYQIRSCGLAHPRASVPVEQQRDVVTTKWSLQSNASCARTNAGKISGLADYLGFSHRKDFNLTDDESVTLRCVVD